MTAAKISVGAEDVLKQSSLDEPNASREPSLQTRGMQLASGVGLLAVVIILFILVRWWASLPGRPDVAQLSSGANAQQALANYEKLNQIATAQAKELFETIIVKALLPVFTLILGYIFAKSETRR